MNAVAPLVAQDCLERMPAHTVYCLKEVDRTDTPGVLSTDLALIECNRLSPIERAFILEFHREVQ